MAATALIAYAVHQPNSSMDGGQVAMRSSRTLLAAGLAALIAVLLTVSVAWAQEVTILLRTIDDPAVPPDIEFCEDGPIFTNAFLGASAWSLATRAKDGEIVNDQIRQVGTATACLAIIDPAFPPGGELPLYGNFVLQEGTFVGEGSCVVTSNDIPQPGVVLTVCSARVIDAPPGFAGGFAGSATLLNPLQLPGVETGSFWSLRLFLE